MVCTLFPISHTIAHGTDVLDQFSANAPPATEASKPAPSSSGPGRPSDEDATTIAHPDVPEGQKPGEDDDQFMARLTSEMQTMMTQMSQDPAAAGASPEDIAKMGKELDNFTRKLEAEGIQPQDLLKAILGEDVGTQVATDAERERDRRDSQSQSQSRSPEKSSKPSKSKSKSSPKTTSNSTTTTSTSTSKSKQPKSNNFEETLRRTMNRLETSDTAATAATSTTTNNKSEEDLLADLLRSLDPSGSSASLDPNNPQGNSELSSLFLSMMEQLTHKDLLYAPMKELDDKFPTYLSTHQSTLPKAEYTRFTRQQSIVKEIVSKFEERGYSDDDPACREYIWERMQRMQGEGAPPEDLVSNPFPGMGGAGAGGMPDLSALLGMGGGGGGGDDAEDAQCPTQ